MQTRQVLSGQDINDIYKKDAEVVSSFAGCRREGRLLVVVV